MYLYSARISTKLEFKAYYIIPETMSALWGYTAQLLSFWRIWLIIIEVF